MFGTSLDYVWLILGGSWVTIQLTVYSIILMLAVAIPTGILLSSRFLLLRGIVRCYVEIFRGTSVFVQLFFAYYVLPLAGVSIGPIQAGVLAIGLNGAAYASEVVRAAIGAISKHQREAAIALNLTRWHELRHIILPQAFVIMLPSFGNLSIEVMKATALASLITVSDLTFQAQMVRSQTGETALPFLVILMMYLVISSILIAIVRWLERHFGRGTAQDKR